MAGRFARHENSLFTGSNKTGRGKHGRRIHHQGEVRENDELWRCAATSYSAGVAPRAGAWIETASSTRETQPPPVAPRAGAWIETI